MEKNMPQICTDAVSVETAARMLFGMYLQEMRHFAYLTPLSEQEFTERLQNELTGSRVLTALENGEITGILFYHPHEAGAACSIPVCGYYYRNEKILGRLFQKLAEIEVGDQGCSFSVGLYAHDATAICLYSMMQFGMISEKGIRRIEKYTCGTAQGYEFKHLSRCEVEAHWTEIWELTQSIIDHLKGSPVFYPCNEFTEEVYREFYLSPDTTVHAALDGSGRMVGIIETNRSEEMLLFPRGSSVNVGEAYVVRELRGSGLAAQLLFFAESYERAQGAAFSWVEHGTANPNARGFWNKYFDTWQYEMVRKIEEI